MAGIICASCLVLVPPSYKTLADRAFALIRQHKPKQAKALKELATCYFSAVPADEYKNLPDDGVIAHLQDVYDFISHSTEDVKVRAHIPAWSRHGVVDVLMPDQPFIVDTVWAELNRLGCTIRHSIHPICAMSRNKKGGLDLLKPVLRQEDMRTPPEGAAFMCLIHVEFSEYGSKRALKDVERGVKEALRQSHQASKDFSSMQARLKRVIDACAHYKAPTAELQEDMAFLEWLLAGNFIFLGARHYDVNWKSKREDDGTMVASKDSGLGILKGTSSSLSKPTKISKLPANLRHYMLSDDLLILTKTLDKSRVHRRADMDFVSVKEFDEEGRVTGEHRFVGLFTSKAYTTSARDIPIVGRKIREVLKESGFGTADYNYKALVNIMETYPKDELLQISVPDLKRIATGILHLQERPEVRLFVRHSPWEKLVSTLVYLPRERMSSNTREKVQKILCDAYHAVDTEWRVNIGDSNLAQIFTKIRVQGDDIPKVNEGVVEEKIVAATRLWRDDFKAELLEKLGEDQGVAMYQKYADGLWGDYTAHSSPKTAVSDVDVLERMNNVEGGPSFLATVRRREDGKLRLKVFHRETQINLSDVMPYFNDMGLYVTTEHPARIEAADGSVVWVHDFGFSLTLDMNVSTIAPVLTKAVEMVWRGELETDRLNSLFLQGLDLRQVLILRAFSAFAHQTGHYYAKEYVHNTLVKHPTLARALVDLFDACLDPNLKKEEAEKAEKKARTFLVEGLKTVSVLDEDRVIQRLCDAITATKRTNAWQRENEEQPLAFKIRSEEIPGLVKPRPMFEIFVYHTRVEGVHLRGGMVARGGLRWSDRPSDYRTEVLGLMKAQMVKNAIIVPVGSKGGFVLKVPPCDLKDFDSCDRETLQKAVQNSYTLYINALLSVTDNLIDGKVVGPRKVKRLDKDDPYLVVAADKGTATFSDIANGIAEGADYWPLKKGQKANGFWLGDAFASGGSKGYDHKAMGITAKGAWECVKHHFRQQGKNIQKEDFTCVGVGDMSGDVFGNGMLLSKHTRLVAAFNHLHIFIDPEPDAAKSYAERQRLFNKPHSAWTDYDTKLISRGGGVFSRSAKEIELSVAIQKALGTDKKVVTPNELIRIILKSPVELLWNGGIGTYVKATDESHQDVGDRANDETRVDAPELRAKVVGEGGNLGLTQKARIEYALCGGAINTDAIDNSAGVDTSDHEVNIKILLRLALEKRKLKASERDTLLEEMTEDVGSQVLYDNYLQAQLLTLKQQEGLAADHTSLRLMEHLEKKGLLDPQIEFLPDRETVEERHRDGKGLTRPELSVLISYVKMDLFNKLIESKLPDDPAVAHYLVTYFPQELQFKFSDMMGEHRLKREIIATGLANELVNRMGMTFLDRMREETGHTAATVCQAYLLSKSLFEADSWWMKVEGLDNQVPPEVQNDMHQEVKRLVEFGATWILKNISLPLDIAAEASRFVAPMTEVLQSVHAYLNEVPKHRLEKRIKKWKEAGVPAEMAEPLGLIPAMRAGPDLADLSLKTGRSVKEVLAAYYKVDEMFRVALLYLHLQDVPVENNWQRLAKISLGENMFAFQKSITKKVLKSWKPGQTTDEAVEKWVHRHKAGVRQYQELLAELSEANVKTRTMLTVMVGHLKQLAT